MRTIFYERVVLAAETMFPKPEKYDDALEPIIRQNNISNFILTVLQMLEDIGVTWTPTFKDDMRCLPQNKSACFFYTKWSKIMHGSFYLKDSFDRDFVFISSDGGHFLFDTVTHFMSFSPQIPNGNIATA